MEHARVLLAVVWLVIVILAIVTCFQKGKQGFGVLGIAGLFFPMLALFAIVGSVRLAKPTSSWAIERYYEDKMERARERFPEEVVSDIPDEVWWVEDSSL